MTKATPAPRVAVILDSMSGLSAAEAERLGFAFVPQQIYLDGTVYSDGIDIILARDRDRIFAAKDYKTSMPPLKMVHDAFERLSKENDHVFYLPMNPGISGTYAMAKAAAKEYPNVHVIMNNFLSGSSVHAGNYIKRAIARGDSVAAIIKFLDGISDAHFIALIPEDVAALVRSGRLSGFKRVAFVRAHLLPLTRLTRSGIGLVGIKRSFERAVKDGVAKAVEYAGGPSKIEEFQFEIVHCGSDSAIALAEAAMKENGVTSYTRAYTAASVSGNVGKGAIGISAYPKKLITS